MGSPEFKPQSHQKQTNKQKTSNCQALKTVLTEEKALHMRPWAHSPKIMHINGAQCNILTHAKKKKKE
jgi:hypothetical protein